MVFFGVEVASVFVCAVKQSGLFYLGELPTLKEEYRAVRLLCSLYAYLTRILLDKRRQRVMGNMGVSNSCILYRVKDCYPIFTPFLLPLLVHIFV